MPARQGLIARVCLSVTSRLVSRAPLAPLIASRNPAALRQAIFGGQKMPRASYHKMDAPLGLRFYSHASTPCASSRAPGSGLPLQRARPLARVTTGVCVQKRNRALAGAASSHSCRVQPNTAQPNTTTCTHRTGSYAPRSEHERTRYCTCIAQRAPHVVGPRRSQLSRH